MDLPLIDQQQHGYRNGHQLIATSRRLPRDDQDLIDRMSDVAGQLRPNETFKPYLTAYPLPSGTFYVVARTWQDLEAPRSGCVRTRSLLVPAEAWSEMAGLGSLLPLLQPVVFSEKPAAVPPSTVVAGAKPVSDPRKVELAEALFLEPRQPIVVFESQEAEAILERVFSALWPAIKRNFAACSFTLSPRKIEGLDFDLSFAPKSARGRFSDWNGRRIEATSKDVRHRWSTQIATRIFDSQTPDLRLIDELGALRADSKGDEGALRLSLLWNELAGKASTTPSAVLGMLDILNSRAVLDVKDGRLAELVGGAARLAVDGPDEADAWRFLSTLAAKVSNFDVEMLKSFDLKGLTRDLAFRNPGQALIFLDAEQGEVREPAPQIVAGVADGVGERRFDDETAAIALRLPTETSAAMISQSEAFAGEVWNRCARDPREWVAATVASIKSMAREERVNLVRWIAPWMRSEAQAPLLEASLEGVAPDALSEFVVDIGTKTGFENTAFDEPMANAAKDVETLHRLRAAVLSHFDGRNADRFLLATLDLAAPDVEWLAHEVRDRRRAVGLLRALIDSATARSLVSVQRDHAARDAILGLLMEDVAGSAGQLVRILLLGDDLPIDRVLAVGEAVFPFVDSEKEKQLSQDLLKRAFVEGDLDDPRIESLFSKAAPSLTVRQMVHLATPPNAGPARLARNLSILVRTSEQVRTALASAVDDLSERLVRRGRENLGEPAYLAWSALIIEAGRRHSDVQLRAALPTLSFALARQDLPVSSLIVASFPVAYAQLLRSTGDDDFRLLPALLSLPLSFFVDWDRAKHARHDLVDKFLHSSWPPADLALTSIAAGIEENTFWRLTRSYRGADYVAAIDRDSHRLAPDQFSDVQNWLKRFR